MIALHASGLDWEAARDEIEQAYGHYGFVHTINNAAVVAAALLWGEEDFTKVIGLAVQGGWDTDCNGATAGSAFGARYGTAAIPERWVAPLNNHLRKRALRIRQLEDLRSRRAHRRAQRSAPRSDLKPARVPPARGDGQREREYVVAWDVRMQASRRFKTSGRMRTP